MEDKNDPPTGGRAMASDDADMKPMSFSGQDLSGYDIPVFYPKIIPTMKMDKATGRTIDVATGEELSIALNSMGQKFGAVIRKNGQPIVQFRGHIGTGFKPGFGKTRAYVVEYAYRGDVVNPSHGLLGRDKMKLNRIADFLGNNIGTIGRDRYAGNVVVFDGRGVEVRYVEF